jgi:hypothetical protein
VTFFRPGQKHPLGGREQNLKLVVWSSTYPVCLEGTRRRAGRALVRFSVLWARGRAPARVACLCVLGCGAVRLGCVRAVRSSSAPSRGATRSLPGFSKPVSSRATVAKSPRRVREHQGPGSARLWRTDWAAPVQRERTRSLIPGVTTEIVRNGNHFLSLDRPRELQHLIAGFARN